MAEPRKVLVITYYWPPAGGPGVQRWLKFVKYLPQFGWQPTVFIPENPSYPLMDETLTAEISPDLSVVKSPIWEPYHLAELFGRQNKKFKAGQFDIGKNQSWKSRLSIWIRGNFFIPDARVFWVKPSVRRLTKYLQNHAFDAIVTTGPPHSVHLIGMELRQRFPHLKWIADFRDPWTEISYYKHLKLTAASDRKHRRLEQKVFNTADITLATSYADAEQFRKRGARAYCITNGFDQDVSVERKIKHTEKFTLSYIGVLEQLRNPEVLWKTLSKIAEEDPEFLNNFELKFVGRIDGQILTRLDSSPLKESMVNTGYLPHAEANQEMHDSDLLLITNFPEPKSRGIIPGKIFEYLASGRQILSFGPAESDVKKILEETGAGMHFSYSDEAALHRFLCERYEAWKRGETSSEIRDISKFSRRHLAKSLADLLDDL